MVGTNKTHKKQIKKEEGKGFKRGNLKPTSEEIITQNVNEELFQAIKEKDFSNIKKLLKKGASFCLDEKEKSISYSNILSDYTEKEIDKLIEIIYKIKNEEIGMEIFCLPAKRSFTICGILESFRESIKYGDLIKFNNALEDGNKFNYDVANHIILEFDEHSGVSRMGNSTHIDCGKLDLTGTKITPLLLCVREGRMKMFNELMKKNPDLLFIDKNENSALSIAKRLGRFEMVTILEEKLHLSLCDAIKDKNFDEIEKILIAGGRLTQEDKKFISEVMKTYTPEEETKFDLLYSKKYN